MRPAGKLLIKLNRESTSFWRGVDSETVVQDFFAKALPNSAIHKMFSFISSALRATALTISDYR